MRVLIYFIRDRINQILMLKKLFVYGKIQKLFVRVLNINLLANIFKHHLSVFENKWVYVNFSYYFWQRWTMKSLAKINSFTLC